MPPSNHNSLIVAVMGILQIALPEETVQEVKRSQAAPVFLQRMLKEAAIGFPNNL